jgi:glycosyltransferase involved in cell wall biosynthesis
MNRRVTVVTPWLPTPGSPMRGSFVATSVASLRALGVDVDVVHLEDWRTPRGPLAVRRIRRAEARLATHGNLSSPNLEPPRLTVPLPARKTASHAQHATDALRAADAMREWLVLGPEVVHAHVALPTGLIAARHRLPSARLVVTEHASYLSAIFAETKARRLYEEVLDNVDELLCVSRPLREQILTHFPGYEGKVSIVPNGVDFSAIPIRKSPPASPRRWIYVGSLTERKDPLRLLEAFAICHREDPTLEFTLLGEGPLAPRLLLRIDELGLRSVASLQPPVPHSDVAAWILAHDLLVHASWHETFGLTPVEALATKTPVMVSRHSAAESVLGGIEASAGALFPVDATPMQIAEAYRDLRARYASLDLDHAYESLRSRLDVGSVGRELASHLHLNLSERWPSDDPNSDDRGDD